MPNSDQGAASALALLMVASGTAATLVLKAQFAIEAHGTDECAASDGGDGAITLLCAFNKPWFGVLQMKLGMALCLPYLCVRRELTPAAARRHPGLETPLPPRRFALSARAATGGGGGGAATAAASINLPPPTEASPLVKADANDGAPVSGCVALALAVAVPSVLDVLQARRKRWFSASAQRVLL